MNLNPSQFRRNWSEDAVCESNGDLSVVHSAKKTCANSCPSLNNRHSHEQVHHMPLIDWMRDRSCASMLISGPCKFLAQRLEQMRLFLSYPGGYDEDHDIEFVVLTLTNTIPRKGHLRTIPRPVGIRMFVSTNQLISEMDLPRLFVLKETRTCPATTDRTVP